jgi:beta-phosphoglucomutase-like phosphatase (HAD superfamily)
MPANDACVIIGAGSAGAKAAQALSEEGCNGDAEHDVTLRLGTAVTAVAPVDGGEAARPELRSKPHPALFLTAARRLGVPAERAAVAEDAPAGIEAGRRGGFAPVAGADSTVGPDSRARLVRPGADIVIRDLEDLLVAGRPQ